MKKKNLVLGTALVVAALFTTTFIVSCNKQENNIAATPTVKTEKKTRSTNYSELGMRTTENSIVISSVTNIVDVLSTELVINKLNSKGYSLSINDVMVNMTDGISQNSGYAIDLKTGDKNVKASLIIVTISEINKVYSVYLSEQKNNENGRLKTSIYSFGDNFEFDLDNPQINSAWRNCFVSAWAELTDDLVGQIACGTNPGVCLAACAIHCSIGGVYNPWWSLPHSQSEIEAYLCLHYNINCNLITISSNSITFV